MSIERRAAPRVQDPRRVRLEHEGGTLAASIVDLSTGGAFLIAPVELKPGSLIHLRLPPPLTRRETRVSAMVVRRGSAGGETGYGVMFADLPADTKKELTAYVAKRLAPATGAAAKNARLRDIQRALRERGARERAKAAASAPLPTKPLRKLKSKDADTLPDWARGVDLRELYKDALDSVKNGQEPGAVQPPQPKTRGR